MRRRTTAGPRRTRPPVVVMAALVLAASCGGGGASSALADLAKGDWNCTWRETPAVDLGGSGAGQDVKVTATITPDSGTRGTFRLKVAAGAPGFAISGNWRLTGSDLTVAITSYGGSAGNGPKLVYGGVAPGARTIEVKGDPPTPVAVTHHDGTYEFQWASAEDIQDHLTCQR